MTLEKLQADMIAALKNKDTFRKTQLSSLVAAVKKAGIDNLCRDKIPEEIVNKALLKEQKMAQEMLSTCPSERKDEYAKIKKGLEIINEYAPTLLNDPIEIKNQIIQLCDNADVIISKKNKSAAMKIIMPYFKGKADMKIVSKIISELFSREE